jgi:hypothetical protein
MVVWTARNSSQRHRRLNRWPPVTVLSDDASLFEATMRPPDDSRDQSDQGRPAHAIGGGLESVCRLIPRPLRVSRRSADCLAATEP